MFCGHDNVNADEIPCEVCPRACMSFPVEVVAKFDIAEERGDLTIGGNFHNLHVCLTRDELASGV